MPPKPGELWEHAVFLTRASGKSAFFWQEANLDYLVELDLSPRSILLHFSHIIDLDSRPRWNLGNFQFVHTAIFHFDGIAFFQYASKCLLFVFLLVAECDLSLAVVSGRNFTSPCVTVISHRIVIRFRGAFLGVGVGKAKNYQKWGEKKSINLYFLSDEDFS